MRTFAYCFIIKSKSACSNFYLRKDPAWLLPWSVQNGEALLSAIHATHIQTTTLLCNGFILQFMRFFLPFQSINKCAKNTILNTRASNQPYHNRFSYF